MYVLDLVFLPTLEHRIFSSTRDEISDFGKFSMILVILEYSFALARIGLWYYTKSTMLKVGGNPKYLVKCAL